MNSNLLSLAPTILSFLGGPAGGLAGAGIQWLASKLGAPESTVDSINKTLQGWSPADTIKLKEIDIEFQKFTLEQGIKIDLAQIEVNKIEAASESFFKSGWRPAAGWVCVVALALTYIPKALVMTGFWMFQSYLILTETSRAVPTLPAFPDLGVTDLLGLLLSLLGMATLRTIDKTPRKE